MFDCQVYDSFTKGLGAVEVRGRTSVANLPHLFGELARLESNCFAENVRIINTP
jgi:Leu/Phe-tRNA-protein transferase